MTGLLLVAVLLLAGVYAPNPYVAVALLSLCFGFTQFTEGAFWSASTYVAGPHTSAATGVLNTGGNLPVSSRRSWGSCSIASAGCRRSRAARSSR